MKNYKPEMSFDEESAARYDSDPDVTLRADTGATVAFLERLAGGGPALELAIGTGRVALPLAARGIRVDGVDFSPGMVARLRAKPGGDRLSVTMGNFADVPVEGSYHLIYIVFNTLFNLLTQDEQVRCFENVAAHLAEDGVFVVEAYVPCVTRDQYVDAEAIEVDEVTLDVGRLDTATQMYYESHVALSREGVRLFPIVQRYAWPAELDLMARIAGLRLRERWGGWEREAFTGASRNCVSVYGR
jgi:SAM-dependent methyltransferase